jgi:hypothetical protein
MLDSTNFRISPEHEKIMGPIPVPDLDHLAIPPDTEEARRAAGRGNGDQKVLSKEEREPLNAVNAAEWIAHLARDKKFTIYISTPVVERRTEEPNTPFAEIRPPARGGKKPTLVITHKRIYDNIQRPDDEQAVSRYKVFFETLGKQVIVKNNQSWVDLTRRVRNDLFSPSREYVSSPVVERKGR